MSWLIKTDKDKFEVWSENEYSTMKLKCEYYGSKPHWTEVRQLEKPQNTSKLHWNFFNSSKKGKNS